MLITGQAEVMAILLMLIEGGRRSDDNFKGGRRSDDNLKEK